jgi:recombination associated protein RdgC
MFKALTIFLTPDWQFDPVAAEEALSLAPFHPVGPTSTSSVGFVPPRGPEQKLVESIGKQHVIKLMTESRTVPGDVLRRATAERVAKIEQDTGRKPGRRETKDIKAEVELDLLPRAFPKRSSALIWIDQEAHRMLIGSTSSNMVDTALSHVFSSLVSGPIQFLPPWTETAPRTAMSEWLTSGEAPEGLSIGNDCTLESTGEDRAVVRYTRHFLSDVEMGHHIEQGKLPSSLELTWSDSVKFKLTHDLALNDIDLLEFAQQDSSPDDFDASLAIGTGTLAQLIDNLFLALGGLTQPEPEAAQAA